FARNIDWRIVGLLAAGSVPATVVVLALLSLVDLDAVPVRHGLNVALGIVLLITSAFLLLGRQLHERYAKRVDRLSDGSVRNLTVLLGVVMGALVTLTSVGAGAIGVTVLLFLHPKIPIARVVGSDIAHAVPLTLVAGLGHWYLGSVNWALLWPLLLGSVPGIVVGSRLAGRVRDGAIRTALALVLIAVAGKLIL
ncbi:MAG: sulfite exporter TauE/SafE family protein, partial [Bradyrhizobium sp.]